MVFLFVSQFIKFTHLIFFILIKSIVLWYHCAEIVFDEIIEKDLETFIIKQHYESSDLESANNCYEKFLLARNVILKY